MSDNWRDWPVHKYSDAKTFEDLAEHFEYFDDDVLINTYCKSGTTLTQELVYSLLYGVPAAKASPLFLRSPFMDWGKPDSETGLRQMDHAKDIQRPRVLKTHLPAAFHTRHLSQSHGPRVIVAMRNPKDTMVSAFHHFRSHENHEADAPNFETAWKLLAMDSRCGSQTGYHNYFEFTLSWWAQRDHPRVRVYFYEDMLVRKAETVRSIAQFLGVPVTEERVQEIVEFTSFGSMKANPMVNVTLLDETKSPWTNKDFSFVRKGEVGDWKNHFTVADNELMNRLIQQNFGQGGPKFVYE